MKIIRPSIFAFAALFVMSLVSAEALAHCDTMDGPVVKAAQVALSTRNVNSILIWVHKQDEAEVTSAFQRALKVRQLSQTARELADNYFFEIVVRLHRAGEGESYTGLKPAGTKVPPMISALDTAIETGSVEPFLTKVPAEARDGILKRFKQVVTQKKFDINDVAAGREYVKSYVTFLHYVEHLAEEQGSTEQHPGE
jgi:hypothetical protein